MPSTAWRAAAARDRRGLARRLGWGLLGFIGYMLSPLSPWNDAFVNLPIAYAAAKLLHHVLGLNEFLGFQLGYAASNTAGLVLMAFSGQALLSGNKQEKRRWLLRATLISVVYGVAASLVLAALGLLEPP